MEAGRPILVLQHDPVVPPAGLVCLLDSRAGRRPWRLVRLGAGAALPDAAEAAGLLVLGGTMGVGDADHHPWMAGELELLRDATEREVPVFGICLGSQLLATALGGKVVTRATPEIGYLPLTRTDAAHGDEVFGGWPDGGTALLIHDDEVVELPSGGSAMLMGSDGTTAWRLGRSRAVQFHPEIDPELLALWLARPRAPDRLSRAGVDRDELLDETRRRHPFLRATGLSLVGRWLDAVVG